MKHRSRLISAGVGMAMLIGSMFTFPGTAHAAVGDLVITGGITSAFPYLGTANIDWAGSGDLTGGGALWTSNTPTTMIGTAAPWLPNCFEITITVPTGNDIIAINTATDTATHAITNATITIDGTGCPYPPQGICDLNLNSTKTFTTATGGFPDAPATPPTYRTGTFTLAATGIGSITISDAGTGNCLSSGLAALIAWAYDMPAGACTAPAALPKNCTSSRPFGGSLTKELQVA